MKPIVAITLLPAIALLATSAFAQGAFGLHPIDSCDEYVGTGDEPSPNGYWLQFRRSAMEPGPR